MNMRSFFRSSAFPVLARLLPMPGNVIGLLDSTGTQVVKYTYDAWGKPSSKSSTLKNTLGTVQPCGQYNPWHGNRYEYGHSNNTASLCYKCLLVEKVVGNLEKNDKDHQVKELQMDKKVVIAQVLYCMAVHDKTQPRRLLTHRYRRKLSSCLTMYKLLLSWLKSSTSLEKDQTLFLLHYIEEHPEIFPAIPTAIVISLQNDDYAIMQEVAMNGEWNMLIAKMEEIILFIEKWLSSPWVLHNEKWIVGFLAFHNLPRPFMDCDHIGLWSDLISPMSSVSAMQAAQFYPIA